MSFPSNWPDRPMSAALTLGGKKLGKQWSACCPAHDDKSPSLVIFEGRTSAVRVRGMSELRADGRDTGHRTSIISRNCPNPTKNGGRKRLLPRPPTSVLVARARERPPEGG